MKTLSQQLLQEAQAKNLCAEFVNTWKDMSKAEFIEFFKKHGNWCCERQFPSQAILLEHFDNQECRDLGLYINREINITIDKLNYVFINCTGKVHAILNPNDPHFPMIYVSGESDLTFTGERVRCPIYTFDNAKVSVDKCFTVKYLKYQDGKD